MRQCIALIHKDADSGYGVSFPDFSGCISAGQTLDDAGAEVITGNVIEGAKRGAVTGHKWAEIATGDLAVEGAEAFAHLTVAGNRVL